MRSHEHTIFYACVFTRNCSKQKQISATASAGLGHFKNNALFIHLSCAILLATLIYYVSTFLSRYSEVYNSHILTEM